MTQDDAEAALKLAQENSLDLQTLTARVEEISDQVQVLGEQLEAVPTDKLQEYAGQIDSLQQLLQSAEAKLPTTAIPASSVSVDPARTAGTLPAAGATSSHGKISAPEAALYKKASDLFYARDYAGAISVYRQLESEYPQGGYVDHAEYWIGECQFALKQYPEAIASFRKVLEFKQTEKADDAQFKLGYCYLRMGDPKQATAEFRKFVSLYPDSEYFEKAKSELTKLESAESTGPSQSPSQN